MNVNHDYKPNPSQYRFHSSNKQYKGFKGAKGSGKTRALIEECVMLAWEFPGNLGVVCRKDYPALSRTTMKYFLEWMVPQLKLEFNQVERKLIVRSRTGQPSTIYFVQEKEPKEFDSMELGFFAVDEADECPHDTVKILMSRLRLKNVPHYGLFAFNPTNRLHWLYKFFVEDPKGNSELVRTRELIENNTYENELNLPSDYIENLKQTYTGDELKRFLLGEWGSTSSEWGVFNSWRSTIHMSQDRILPVPGVPIIRAWDYGMRAGCLVSQLVGPQLRVLSPEFLEFNRGADTFGHIVLPRCAQEFPRYRFVELSDPTFIGNRSPVDARSIRQVMKDQHNVDIDAGVSDWQERLRCVNHFLESFAQGAPGLLVDPACKMLIGGFEGGYKFREGAYTRKASDIDKNEYSELMDCLQHTAWYARKQTRMTQNSIGGGLYVEQYDFTN